MQGSQNIPSTHIQLAVNKRIDAICDRFEAAWTAGQRPRIEDYLSELPSAERLELFRELLASEVAFKSATDPDATYDQYLKRFPDYRDCILEVFSNAPTHRLSGESVSQAVDQTTLIEKVRQRLRPAEHTQNPATITTNSNALDGRPSGTPSPGVEPLSDRLWDLLIRRAQLPDPASPQTTGNLQSIDQLESTALQLLNAFPSLRREILLNLLLGLTVPQVAQKQRATERTVIVTLQTAIKLLA